MTSTNLISPSRRELLARLPVGGIAAEIGVWEGDFSDAIMDWCCPARLHLIDPWVFTMEFGKRWYGGLKAKSQADMDAIFAHVCDRFAKYEQVTIHRCASSSAALLFPAHYFDWVYIDGNHNYEFVRRDLQDFASKIKRGGYLTGDDYSWESPEQPGDFPVQRAVEEFAAENQMQVEIIGGQFLLRITE
jgi:hypothetical protein